MLAVRRMLNTYKHQDYVRTAQQAVICIDHHINLVLKAAQSRTDMVKSSNITQIAWCIRASLGLTHCYADLIGYVECGIDAIDIFKLNKVIGSVLHNMRSLQQIVTYSMSPPFCNLAIYP